MIMVHRVHISELQRKNTDAGNYFFSAGAMRFFSSKTDEHATIKGNKGYFITSEQFKGDRRSGLKSLPRKFTVRVMDMKSGSVSTIGEFQQFGTHGQAKKKIEELTK